MSRFRNLLICLVLKSSLTCHDQVTFWCSLKSNSTSLLWCSKRMRPTVRQCHRTVKFTSPSHHRFSLAGQRMSGIYIHTINETYPSDAFREWPWNVELRKAKIPQLQHEHVRWEIALKNKETVKPHKERFQQIGRAHV